MDWISFAFDAQTAPMNKPAAPAAPAEQAANLCDAPRSAVLAAHVLPPGACHLRAATCRAQWSAAAGLCAGTGTGTIINVGVEGLAVSGRNYSEAVRLYACCAENYVASGLRMHAASHTPAAGAGTSRRAQRRRLSQQPQDW